MQRTIETGKQRYRLHYDSLAAIVGQWWDGYDPDPENLLEGLPAAYRESSALNRYVVYRIERVLSDHGVTCGQVEYSVGCDGVGRSGQLKIVLYYDSDSESLILDTIVLCRRAILQTGTPRYVSFLLPRTMMSFSSQPRDESGKPAAVQHNPCAPLIACVYRTVAFVNDVPHAYNVDYDFGNELCFLAAKLLHGDESSDEPLPPSIEQLISELDRRFYYDVSYTRPTQSGELIPVLSIDTKPVLVKVTVLHRQTRKIAHEVVCRL